MAEKTYFILWRGGRYRVKIDDDTLALPENNVASSVPYNSLSARTLDSDYISCDDFNLTTAIEQATRAKTDLPTTARLLGLPDTFASPGSCTIEPDDCPSGPSRDCVDWDEQLLLDDAAGEPRFLSFVHPPEYNQDGDGQASVANSGWWILPVLTTRATDASVQIDPATGFEVEYQVMGGKRFSRVTVRPMFWDNITDDQGRTISKHVWQMEVVLFAAGAPTFFMWIGRRQGLLPFGRYDLVDQTTFAAERDAQSGSGEHQCALNNIGSELSLEADDGLSDALNTL